MASRAVALDSTRGGRLTPARPRGTTQPARTPEPSKLKRPEPAPAPSREPEQASPQPPPPPAPRGSGGGGGVTVPASLDSGAGFVLGLLVWGWIVLPFLTGGPTSVKNVLRAKFFNKAPDGSWLP